MYEKIISGGDHKRKYDLILVNAPLKNYDKSPKLNKFTLPVLGLGYIATYCEKKGWNIGVIDCEGLGLGITKVAKILNELMPRWVGFNLLAPTYTLSRSIAEKLHPDMKIILGGHQAKAMPRDIILDQGFPKIDAMVLGESELRVEEILRNEKNKEFLPDVYYRSEFGDFLGGKIDRTGKGYSYWTAPDVNGLPFVNRQFLTQDPFRTEEGKIEANIVGSRGCPYDCSFCGAAKSANPDISIRTRNPLNILEEMFSLSNELQVDSFRFVDDLFLANPRFMKKCLPEFVNKEVGNKFVWDATGRINILAKASDDLFLLMKKAGCREVALGIESGSARVLKYIDKHVSPDMTIKAVQNLTKHGIHVKGYVIMGFPTETESELKETYNHIHLLWKKAKNNSGNFRCSVFEFRPYPGTPEWNRIMKTGRFTKEQLLNYSHVDMTDEGVDQKMLDRDEFNFSVNLQFGEAPIKMVRDLIADLTRKQKDIWMPKGERVN